MWPLVTVSLTVLLESLAHNTNVLNRQPLEARIAPHGCSHADPTQGLSSLEDVIREGHFGG